MDVPEPMSWSKRECLESLLANLVVWKMVHALHVYLHLRQYCRKWKYRSDIDKIEIAGEH